MTSEELQAMLQAAYSGQVNPATMGLDYGPPKSEWESEKYNAGRTPEGYATKYGMATAVGDASPMSLSDYPKVWYDRTIGQALKGATGAGDALLGRTNPDVATFEKDVLDALSLYAGPTIAKGMLGGVPSANRLNIFGGELGANPSQLRMKAIAEKALAAGKDPDEVWKWTGWKPGMEGKMRFEISDKDMALNPEFWGQGGAKYSSWMDPKKNEWADIRMGQVAKHDAAYANYPEMRDVKVRLGQPDSMGSKQGFYDEATNTATIKANLTREEATETLLHEVGGHFVQKEEGFARGGSIEGMSYDEINQLNKRVDFLKSKQSGLEKSFNDARDKFIKLYKSDGQEVANAWFAKQPEVNEFVQYQREIESLTAKSHNMRPDYMEGERKYRSLAGEIEANDIVNRRTWDTDMRRAVPPDMRKDAIVRMGNPDTDAFVADVLKELNY